MNLYALGEVPQNLIRFAVSQTPVTGDFKSRSVESIAGIVYAGIAKKFATPTDCDVNVIHFEGDPNDLTWQVKGQKPYQAFIGLRGRLEEYEAFFFGVYPKAAIRANPIAAITIPGGLPGLDRVRSSDLTPGTLARKLVAFEKAFPRIFKRAKGVDLSDVVIGEVWDHVVELGGIELDASLIPED
jgi:hypothetical protein